MTTPPESPPAGPVIPIGLGTRLGIATGALGAFVALLASVLHGDHTPETITGLALAGLAVVRTIDGRMAQATAAITNPVKPSLAPPYLTTGVGNVIGTSGNTGTFKVYEAAQDPAAHLDRDEALVDSDDAAFPLPGDFDPAHEQRGDACGARGADSIQGDLT